MYGDYQQGTTHFGVSDYSNTGSNTGIFTPSSLTQVTDTRHDRKLDYVIIGVKLIKEGRHNSPTVLSNYTSRLRIKPY